MGSAAKLIQLAALLFIAYQ